MLRVVLVIATLATGYDLVKKKHHKKKHAGKKTSVVSGASLRQDPAPAAPAADAAPAAAAAPPAADPAAAAAAPPAAPAAAAATAGSPPATAAPPPEQKAAIANQLKKLAQSMDGPVGPPAGVNEGSDFVSATLQVAGPIAPDFGPLFAKEAAVALAKSGVTADEGSISILSSKPVPTTLGKNVQILELTFKAPAKVAHEIKVQAATENSPLATGPLEKFLSLSEQEPVSTGVPPPPPADTGLEIDGEIPFGNLEPFGQEDTANELTQQSISESNAMVDQIERAQVAEEKRSVFRALTRLRGAAITSFDGVARSQTANIDDYNHTHQWRLAHPVKHLAQEEADVSKWAFPSS